MSIGMVVHWAYTYFKFNCVTWCPPAVYLLIVLLD